MPQASRRRERFDVNERALETAARALCRLDGHPENATFRGTPMWKSFLPKARASLEAARADVQETVSRQMN